MYRTAKMVFDKTTEFPIRSTPGLRDEMLCIRGQGEASFENQPPTWTSYNYPPPRPTLCKTRWLPITKKDAVNKPEAAAELFRTLYREIPASTLCIFTDGSKSSTAQTTACALHIPDRNLSQSWSLSNQASIFSAELLAVDLALDLTYKLNEYPQEVMIFCDSSSAIKTIASTNPGIEGNEEADRLAHYECTNPSGTKSGLPPLPIRIIGLLRADWKENLLGDLKKCQKTCIQVMTKTGLTDWFPHKDRATTICLHRLRSGHNHLNSFNHRIDKKADPSCRKGCEAMENVKHILIDCPATENQRQEIRLLLASLNVTMDIPPSRHYLAGGPYVPPICRSEEVVEGVVAENTSQVEHPRELGQQSARYHQERQNQLAARPVTSSRKSLRKPRNKYTQREGWAYATGQPFKRSRTQVVGTKINKSAPGTKIQQISVLSQRIAV
ncbi:hypothetical protein DAPPUDRAFT_108042 [Daphnia pulex]|uniref:RNase H type-1 domain-containing protein n=1 Tax=Daphnia pulex TaxID=6669 RepID=E9GYZ9_DAPPU|nr:hypothetical protein DAPPUDRAFT_108042 [Daphnia pulex]|eukprot:EFX75318.1 hypothetical protein DAPPUDRAFT_108042 [Daphnia pulex]